MSDLDDLTWKVCEKSWLARRQPEVTKVIVQHSLEYIAQYGCTAEADMRWYAEDRWQHKPHPVLGWILKVAIYELISTVIELLAYWWLLPLLTGDQMPNEKALMIAALEEIKQA